MSSLNVAVIVSVSPDLTEPSASEYVIAAVGAVVSIVNVVPVGDAALLVAASATVLKLTVATPSRYAEPSSVTTVYAYVQTI